jgi:hypothetical protein
LTRAEAEFLTKFIVGSDAIEGIANAPEIVRWAIVNDAPQFPGGPPGHVGALLMLRAYQGLLDVPIVQLVQRLITEEQHLKGERRLQPQDLGAWRTHNVAIRESDDITRPPRPIGSKWQNVPREMNGLTEEVATWQQHLGPRDTQRERITAIARFHWMYERIHPFADGNGRSGRALVYYLYRFAGLTPFAFTHLDAGRAYYPCFQRPDAAAMERYFLDRTPVVR